MKNGLIIISSVSREFLILNDRVKKEKKKRAYPVKTLSVLCLSVSGVLGSVGLACLIDL